MNNSKQGRGLLDKEQPVLYTLTDFRFHYFVKIHEPKKDGKDS
jgi:hypothetical protein